LRVGDTVRGMVTYNDGSMGGIWLDVGLMRDGLLLYGQTEGTIKGKDVKKIRQGFEIECYVKDVNQDTGRFGLTMKNPLGNGVKIDNGSIADINSLVERRRYGLDDPVQWGQSRRGKVVGFSRAGFAWLDIGDDEDAQLHQEDTNFTTALGDVLMKGDELDVWIKSTRNQRGRPCLVTAVRPRREFKRLFPGKRVKGRVARADMQGSVFIDIGLARDCMLRRYEIPLDWEFGNGNLTVGQNITTYVKAVIREEGSAQLTLSEEIADEMFGEWVARLQKKYQQKSDSRTASGGLNAREANPWEDPDFFRKEMENLDDDE